MQFTDKEIDLAKQLQGAGLKWVPKIGDFYIYDVKGNRYNLVTGIDYDHGDKGWIYVRSPSDGLRNINGLCWLPLWHQVRSFLKKHSLELTISDVPRGTDVTLTLWKRCLEGGIEFYTQIVANTDLEAMYQVLLEALKNKGRAFLF